MQRTRKFTSGAENSQGSHTMTAAPRSRCIVSALCSVMMRTNMFKMKVTVLLMMIMSFVAAENMNAGQYLIANSEAFPTSYHDHEYFDVYSPLIKTRYSEVYWRMQEAVPLPTDIQERFKDKIMAVTGYEVDQVRVTPSGKEVPVPITWAYNHHYGGYLSNSEKTKFIKRPAGPDRMYMNHNSKEYWTAQVIDEQGDDVESDIPLHFLFGSQWRRIPSLLSWIS